MNQKLREQIQEAFSSVMPITIIVLILSAVLIPIPAGTLIMFLVGSALLSIGVGVFTLGADMAMIPMGEGVGVQFTKIKKLSLLVLISIGMGIIITIAEPDLQVLATQVASIPNYILIGVISGGVGIFLAISVLRIFFQISLAKILIFSYILAFVMSAFVPMDFIPLAFDSGGVTTGAISVPFILALGMGLSSVRSDKNSRDDSFGLSALCSIGPVIMVLVLGMIYKPESSGYSPFEITDIGTSKEVIPQFLKQLPEYCTEVITALAPIIFFLLVFQLLTKRYRKHQLARMAVGFVYTLLGITLFLAGVNIGFIPVGHLMGLELAGSSYKWMLVPIGMIVGYFIVLAEPAVHILNKQVEEVSGGAIPPRAMNLCLCIGVAVSVGLSMVRILTGISIFWFLIPGYACAIILTFMVPKIFIGIAFDSGGIASGSMTACFLLPFAIGACEAVGGNVLTDAFGIVAIVAMTPLIVIQILGIIYGNKMKAAEATDGIDLAEFDEIVEYEDKILYEGSGDNE